MERILIVDDEKSIRLTLSEFLKREGYQTETAVDFETAVELINHQDFEVVISDILMPRKSGIELLEFILNQSPFTKVIMITGEPNVETAAQAIRLGACDYLNKPVDKNSVIKSVNNALRIKKLEDNNREYQNNLEKLVEERTSALEQALKEKDAMQQKIIQQERLQGLCIVSSGVAHNINNTLSPIFMYAEALMEKNNYLDAESKKYLEKIINSAEEIEAIVLKMEDLYNIQNDLCSCTESIDTSELIIRTTEFFKRTLDEEKKEILIRTEVSKDLPRVPFEEKTLENILKAVLKNSIEAVGEKGEIKIKNHFDNDFLTITIEDNGTGMNHEEKEHCCDPFYTSKGPRASGLGLTSVYGAINRNNGRMEINSEYGEGTKIILSMPVYQENDEKNLEEKKNA